MVLEIFYFNRLFSFDSFWLNFSSNFAQIVTMEGLKPDLFDCERMISIDYIMNALEYSKI